ncbi:MAG: hypothetical protein CR959_01750 [Fusobacteriales bacterium]|nr:MAG: hypothetical protein CR959_01750 [Fusobacteriales bacterium]
MKLVSDKKAYSLLVYDSIKDKGNDYALDHDLVSNFDLKKENKKYSFNSSYKYLYDLDPGSSTSDLMSRNEKFTTNFTHKETGFLVDYSKRRGDNYRTLDFWESDLTSVLKQRNLLNLDINYTPKTVAKYKFNNYEKLKVNLFNYDMKNYTFTPSISYNFQEKELDRVESSFRKDSLGSGRISEYNRFFDEIYSKNLEKRADFKLYNKNEIYNFAFGKTEENLKTRKGLYGKILDDKDFKTYENKSNFYELFARRNNLNTNMGVFALGAKFRQDSYSDNSDKTNTITLNLSNDFK